MRDLSADEQHTETVMTDSESVIDPAHVSCVLELLPVIGVAPSDTWAEVQYTSLASGEAAIAFSVRLVLDDGLIARHISALKPGETVSGAITRVAASMQRAGMRSVDALGTCADEYEQFHTIESVRELMAQSQAYVPRVVH